ncbi:hypothetical protein H3C61_04085 [Candidatus Gracilibacteria bacterium]|nr:hypothetical protein [Candidatus Gracilibacteria bacterium]
MSKKDITITEVTENYFLRENKKIKIVFSYDYFQDFIQRNGLEEIFSKKLYLKGFDFEIAKISNLDFNLDMENPDFLTKIRNYKDHYISEGLLYLGNDKSKRYGFFFFPDYLKNGEMKNDFLKIKSTEMIDLTDYATFNGLYKRDGIVIALNI